VAPLFKYGGERSADGTSVGKTQGKRHLEDLGVDGKVILKCFLRNGMRAWNGLMWLSIGTGGELLQGQRRKFGSTKMREFRSLAEEHLVTEGLCYIE
jgi:hypothetical protein